MIIDNHPFPVNKDGHLEIGGIDSTHLAKNMVHRFMYTMCK